MTTMHDGFEMLRSEGAEIGSQEGIMRDPVDNPLDRRGLTVPSSDHQDENDLQHGDFPG
jgi:hypothetical protein